MTGTMITVFDDSYYDWEIVPKYVLTTDTKFSLIKNIIYIVKIAI